MWSIEEDLPPLERRLRAMEAARPHGVPDPCAYADPSRVEAVQLAAFEAGDPEWWRAMPPEGGTLRERGPARQ